MAKVPASHLLGPMFDALLKPLVKFSLLSHFNCSSEQEAGGLEGHTGLPALQLVPFPSRSCVGGEGHGPIVQGLLIYAQGYIPESAA